MRKENGVFDLSAGQARCRAIERPHNPTRAQRRRPLVPQSINRSSGRVRQKVRPLIASTIALDTHLHRKREGENKRETEREKGKKVKGAATMSKTQDGTARKHGEKEKSHTRRTRAAPRQEPVLGLDDMPIEITAAVLIHVPFLGALRATSKTWSTLLDDDQTSSLVRTLCAGVVPLSVLQHLDSTFAYARNAGRCLQRIPLHVLYTTMHDARARHAPGDEDGHLFACGTRYWGPMKGGLPHGRGLAVVTRLKKTRDPVTRTTWTLNPLSEVISIRDSRRPMIGDWFVGEWRRGVLVDGFTSSIAYTVTHQWRDPQPLIDGSVMTKLGFPRIESSCMSPFDATCYTGRVVDGRYHGEGRWEAPHPPAHDGECAYACGGRYVGVWHEGRPTCGTVFFTSGHVYEGQFKDGLFHGDGNLTLCSSLVYRGQWVDGRPHGYGAMHAGPKDAVRNGHTRLIGFYEGSWQCGKRHGEGTMVYADGRVYAGNWDSNRYSGRGAETQADGTCYAGKWRESRLCGRGTITHPDGHRQRAHWKYSDPITAPSLKGYYRAGRGHGSIVRRLVGKTRNALPLMYAAFKEETEGFEWYFESPIPRINF